MIKFPKVTQWGKSGEMQVKPLASCLCTFVCVCVCVGTKQFVTDVSV